MMNGFLYSFAGFILALGVLITVHEFGHFWVARKMGVKVLRFSVGFGPAIWKRQPNPDDTEYVIAAIPLGGYVKMLDENEGEVDAADQHRAFNNKPLARRAAIVIAGPLFNFLFAIIAYWLVFLMGVDGIRPVIGKVTENSIAHELGIRSGDEITHINGRKNLSWSEHRLYLLHQAMQGKTVKFRLKQQEGGSADVNIDLSSLDFYDVNPALVERGIGIRLWLPPVYVGEVYPNEPAAMAGLLTGDRILTVNGAEIGGWQDLVLAIAGRPGESVRIEIERDGRVIPIDVVPRPVTEGERTFGRIGITPHEKSLQFPPEMRTRVEYGLFQSLVAGVETTWIMSSLTLRMLYKMLLAEVSPKNISGPITIARFAGTSAQGGIDRFLLFLAVVSVSLGVLNLLPIPVLDGGHLLYYVIELVSGKPVSRRFMERGQQIGILILVGLMSLAFYNDIVRLLS